MGSRKMRDGENFTIIFCKYNTLYTIGLLWFSVNSLYINQIVQSNNSSTHNNKVQRRVV